jgi:hypothetical protein
LLGQTGERLQILYGVIKPQYIKGNDFREGKAGLGAAGAHSGFLAAVDFQNSIDKVMNDAVCVINIVSVIMDLTPSSRCKNK